MRYCLALDLKEDPQLIKEYEDHHKKIWPEIALSIKQSGITSMEIYRLQNRLFMIMETTQDFSFEQKQIADDQNPTVQKWEQMLWHYQQALPGSKEGEKWRLMNKIFEME